MIPEDFNAYKQLTRPTAKGIFGNLHLWFHASQGRAVEKDYSDLCNLLNVQAYPHLSKIKSTMGLALNELVAIKYLSRWDVQKMSSKTGYKVVLVPGEELMAILENTRSERRDQLAAPTQVDPPESELNREEQAAVYILRNYGVLPAKAARLVVAFGSEAVCETVEYLAAQVIEGKRKNVDNPAGLIIYSLENALPIPASFMSSRKRKAAEEAQKHRRAKEQRLIQEQIAYSEWLDDQHDRLVRDHFTSTELEAKLKEVSFSIAQRDERVHRMTDKAKRDVALRSLRKELSSEVQLPSFEEWRTTSEQTRLF